MKIKNFQEFITESYLSGGKAPLYHFSNSISRILYDDTLKIQRPAMPAFDNERSISLTRNINYGSSKGGDYENYNFLEIDRDLLDRFGYKSYPFDELGAQIKNTKSMNFSKSNFNVVSKGQRWVNHKLNFGDENSADGLELEFEERIFKDIKRFGRFIIKIVLHIDRNKESYLDQYDELKIPIKKYLEEYPDIKVFTYDTDRRKQTDITEKIKSGETKKELA